MAGGVRSPFSGVLYELAEPGRVRVTRRDGEIGYYTPQGRWLDGAKFDADPHLCGWVSSPRNSHRINTASH
ncbi:hypothetical protein HFP15_15350 [Amycolatopsis sp. K13G38]|uniref:Transposase n=1 Tax=Amycolatopsis acididurans TaxID=2724524 RepID=A0ABX1J3B6_9PSEU|nr:hypothetical protein [Amycolatopsis acididurans]NKQ54263.1 hypothetical protein [Amycolatopsis acididurans]